MSTTLHYHCVDTGLEGNITYVSGVPPIPRVGDGIYVEEKYRYVKEVTFKYSPGLFSESTYITLILCKEEP